MRGAVHQSILGSLSGSLWWAADARQVFADQPIADVDVGDEPDESELTGAIHVGERGLIRLRRGANPGDFQQLMVELEGR